MQMQMQNGGFPMADKSERMMLLLSPKEREALVEIAKRNGVSMSEVMRRLIQRSAARYGISTKAAA